MSESLKVGTTIKTQFGKTIIVKEYLAEGGQGEVYKVDLSGESKALKWYKPSSLGENPKAFYENIKQNIMRGSPSQEFLWPIDITEWVGDTFGYIMDLRPKEYHDLSDFIMGKYKFKSYKNVVDAAMRIVSAFRILHNAGYSYQDLNDGNFFINPDNGKVLIADNDNVAPDGTNTGIKGKPRYMAPEIVLNENMPDSLSDRFSLSLILYMLFCLNHPLEGKRFLAPCLTTAMQKKLYGSEPLFMMDPNDKSNGPHPVIHKNSIAIWNCIPSYLKSIFEDSFSQKSFKKPSSRPSEVAWLDVLTRMRSEIVTCSCGNEVFTENGESCRCDACKKKVVIDYRLELSRYSVPIVKGTRIYRCQLGICDEKEALLPVAEVLKKKDSDALGIRNKYTKRWDAINTKGVAKKVAINDIVPVKDGIEFNIEKEIIKIKKN